MRQVAVIVGLVLIGAAAGCGGAAGTGGSPTPLSTSQYSPPPTPTPLSNGLSADGRVANATVFRDTLLASAKAALAADPNATLNEVWMKQFPSLHFYLPEYATTSTPTTVTFASGTAHGGTASADNPAEYAIAVADDSGRCAGGMLYGYPSLDKTKTVDSVSGGCDAVTALKQMGG